MSMDLTDQISERIKEVFQKKKTIKILSINRIENFFDLVIRLIIDKEEWKILAKVCSQEEIRYQPDIIKKIIFRRLLEPPSTHCVIGSLYIGPEEAEICKDSGLGYIDLQGNYFFSFSNFSMEKRGSEKPKIPEEIFKSVFSLKSSRIIRVILEAKRTGDPTPLILRNISKYAKVSLGLVHNVVSKLIDLGYLKKKRGQKGLKVVRPTDLLDEWVKRYNLYQNRIIGFYFSKDKMSEQDDFISYCESKKEKYAITLAWAASQIGATTESTQQISTYFSGDVNNLKKTLNLKEVTTGANLIVIVPEDEFVYYKSFLYSGHVNMVSPIQLCLDLSTFLREKTLGWDCQKVMGNIRAELIGF